jgi:hypothetical protein
MWEGSAPTSPQSTVDNDPEQRMLSDSAEFDHEAWVEAAANAVSRAVYRSQKGKGRHRTRKTVYAEPAHPRGSGDFTPSELLVFDAGMARDGHLSTERQGDSPLPERGSGRLMHGASSLKQFHRGDKDEQSRRRHRRSRSEGKEQEPGPQNGSERSLREEADPMPPAEEAPNWRASQARSMVLTRRGTGEEAGGSRRRVRSRSRKISLDRGEGFESIDTDADIEIIEADSCGRSVPRAPGAEPTPSQRRR